MQAARIGGIANATARYFLSRERCDEIAG